MFRSIQNRQYTLPAGISNCWVVWRHCCCRYGAIPLAIAPFITTACLLSAYSTVGCQFVDLQIGFVPSNNVWNQSNALLGLYYRYDDSTTAAAAAAAAAAVAEDNGNNDGSDGDSNSRSNKYRDYILQPECISYDTAFDNNFVEPDRTWTIARVMALIAVGATCLATITIWAMVVTPGAKCFWGGLLLPCTMLALIAEGSKFLFLDIAMCRSAIWFPSGVDSLPASAETCELGETAYYCIAAGALHLVSLLAVCLHAPERRELDPDFGVEYRTGAEVDLEDAAKQTQEPRQRCRPEELDACRTRSSKSPLNYEEELDEDSVLEDEVYTTSSEPYSATTRTTDDGKMQQQPNPNSMTSPIKEEPSNITLPPTIPENVSESRLSTMSKVERNASSPARKEELVQQLVSELDSCFEGKL